MSGFPEAMAEVDVALLFSSAPDVSSWRGRARLGGSRRAPRA